MATFYPMPRTEVDYNDPKAVGELTDRVRNAQLEMNFVTGGAPVAESGENPRPASHRSGLVFALRTVAAVAVIAAGLFAIKWTSHSRAALLIASGLTGLIAGMIFPPIRTRRR